MMNFLVFIRPKLVQRYSSLKSSKDSTKKSKGSAENAEAGADYLQDEDKFKNDELQVVEENSGGIVAGAGADDLKDEDDNFEDNKL